MPDTSPLAPVIPDHEHHAHDHGHGHTHDHDHHHGVDPEQALIPQIDGAAGEAQIVTFGCRLNSYESEVMRGHVRDAGIEDLVIVNTCAVTSEAERQARQTIRKLRRERPDARIVVTGCAAQIDPDRFAAMPEVDQVLGNQEKLQAESWGLAAPPKVLVNDIMSIRETAGHLVGGFEDRARAFVQIQQGCDHRCTFCIIPYGRGPSRSVPIGGIVEQVQALVKAGYNEVVLSGVDITSFGPDLPGAPTLGQMVRRLLALVPELPRLRLSSIDCIEFDDDLWRLLENEPRLMPHLHLSLQAGDDMILKRMKRRHGRDDAIAFCRRVRTLRPDVVFGADFIAGFPTETEEMFQNTLALVEECGLSWLHVFPYSPRPGTPAARMPQVNGAIRKERAARLRALGQQTVLTMQQALIGQEVSVLIEKADLGRTEHFAEIRLGTELPAGSIHRATVTGIADGVLTGTPLTNSDIP